MNRTIALATQVLRQLYRTRTQLYDSCAKLYTTVTISVLCNKRIYNWILHVRPSFAFASIHSKFVLIVNILHVWWCFRFHFSNLNTLTMPNSLFSSIWSKFWIKFATFPFCRKRTFRCVYLYFDDTFNTLTSIFHLKNCTFNKTNHQRIMIDVIL